MGMRAAIEQITPQQLAEFLQNPPRAYDYVLAEFLGNPTEMAMFETMLKQAEQRMGMTGAAEQLAHIRRERDAMKARAGIHLVKGDKGTQSTANPKPERKRFWLEKDWHVLHYLLNGTAEGGMGPLADAVLGGAEIPDANGIMGYGPLHYLTVEQVSDISAALAVIDPKELLSTFDQKDAIRKHIYLAEALTDQADWSYFAGFFESFQDFYKDAAMHGNAMLLQIT
jgi:hypothetical protein